MLVVGGLATVTEALGSVRLGGRIALIGFLSRSALPLDAIEFDFAKVCSCREVPEGLRRAGATALRVSLEILTGEPCPPAFSPECYDAEDHRHSFVS